MASPAKVKFVTNKVRFSFVHVFEPAPNLSGKMKYSVSVLIPKTDKAGVAAFNKAFEETKQANISYFGGAIPKVLKGALRDGDLEKEDAVYAGHYFFNANSDLKPGVFDESSQAIIDPNEFYSGCYGRASVTMYGYDINGTKGIAYGLNAVKKTEDGEKLGGATASANDFAADFAV
jgi:hypothetical protein